MAEQDTLEPDTVQESLDDDYSTADSAEDIESQFRKQTKQLENQAREKIKAVAKNQAKQELRKAVKKRIALRIAAMATPEIVFILVVVFIALMAIGIIMFFLLNFCTLPGVSYVTGLAASSLPGVDVSLVCEQAGGTARTDDSSSISTNDNTTNPPPSNSSSFECPVLFNIIPDQWTDAKPALRGLIAQLCDIRPEVDFQISSISDDDLFTGRCTPWESGEIFRDDSNCVHRQNSTHYGGTLSPVASSTDPRKHTAGFSCGVDMVSNNYPELENTVRSLGVNFVQCENAVGARISCTGLVHHLHLSISGCGTQ